MIKQLKKTIAKLSENPTEADTVAALKRQLADLQARQCKHGTYTNELFNTHGCKTCGNPKVVICNHSKVIGKRRNSKGCNAQKCKYFENLNLTIN